MAIPKFFVTSFENLESKTRRKNRSLRPNSDDNSFVLVRVSEPIAFIRLTNDGIVRSMWTKSNAKEFYTKHGHTPGEELFLHAMKKIRPKTVFGLLLETGERFAERLARKYGLTKNDDEQYVIPENFSEKFTPKTPFKGRFVAK